MLFRNRCGCVVVFVSVDCKILFACFGLALSPSAYAGEPVSTPVPAPDALGLQTENLVEWVSTSASVNDYRRTMVEAIAVLIWLKRFAEAELP